MIRWLWICLAGSCLPLPAFAINALVSHAVFYTAGNTPQAGEQAPYMELYWQIDPQTIRFEENAKKMWNGSVRTDIIVRNDSGIISEDHFIQKALQANSRQAAILQNMIDLQRFRLPVGKVWVQMQITDIANTENQFLYSDSFDIKKAPAAPFYSDMQLLDTTLYSANEKDPFYKAGKLQVPLSANFLDDYRDRLHYYAELYQTKAASADDTLLIQRVFISRKENEPPVAGLVHTDTLRRNAILAVSGSFNTIMLASGNYYLNAVLENKNGKRLAAATTFFQRINTVPVQAKDTTADTGIQKINLFVLSETFVGKYTIPQLRAILKMISPISTAMEEETIKGFLKKPDETYIRYFIYNFWAARNSKDPEKEWNNYSAIIREVNKLFGSSALAAYETERGQIYLRYGKPEERIIVNNETGALPYEIWQYNAPGKQGRPGVFLFYRPGFMISDYKLLHSTVTGELLNPQWRDFLYLSGGSAAATSNFRAEQYIK